MATLISLIVSTAPLVLCFRQPARALIVPAERAALSAALPSGERSISGRLGVRSCIDASPSFRPASPDVPSASNRVFSRAAPGDGARQRAESQAKARG